MRQFHLIYPIMSELGWTHYLELIKIKEKIKEIIDSSFRYNIK